MLVLVRRNTAWVALTAALCIAGCSQSDDGRIRVYPVSGVVLSAGKPVEGAKVVLYGATPELSGRGKPAPSGVTDVDGEFHLRSFDPDDGAPAGQFRVTVYWPEPLPAGADEEMYQRKDRFQGRYSDPQKSGLTAEIPEGGCELPPFDLK